MIGSQSSLTAASHLVLPSLRVNRAQLQRLLFLRLALTLLLGRLLALNLSGSDFLLLVLRGKQVIEYLIEKILNIGTGLRRHLSVVLRLFFCDFLCGLSGLRGNLTFEVAFVADYIHLDILLAGLAYKIDPLGDALNRGLIWVGNCILARSKTTRAMCASLRQLGMRLLKRYCPAVSHSCNLMIFPLVAMFLLIKSMPMVGYFILLLHFQWGQTRYGCSEL